MHFIPLSGINSLRNKYPEFAKVIGIERKVNINVLANEKGEPIDFKVFGSDFGNIPVTSQTVSWSDPCGKRV